MLTFYKHLTILGFWCPMFSDTTFQSTFQD